MNAPTFDDALREWVERNLFNSNELDDTKAMDVIELAREQLGTDAVTASAIVRALFEIRHDKNHDLVAYPFS